VYILIVLLSLLLGPALYAKVIIGKDPPWLIRYESVLFVIGFGAPLLFYILSQRALQRGWFSSIKYIPALMAVGAGIAFNNAIATLEGFFGKTGEFVRTPKFGEEARKTGDWRHRLAGFRHRRSWQVWAEFGIALYLIACLVGLFFFDNWYERVSAAIPFLLIFIGGYLYVALETFYTQWHASRHAAQSSPS
jgi:ABC-type transport system involved in cytochrome c biogenesis permease subunit